VLPVKILTAGSGLPLTVSLIAMIARSEISLTVHWRPETGLIGAPCVIDLLVCSGPGAWNSGEPGSSGFVAYRSGWRRGAIVLPPVEAEPITSAITIIVGEQLGEFVPQYMRLNGEVKTLM
jgi:hypothetical protein